MSAGGKQLIDNHTTIDHAMPHCGSHKCTRGFSESSRARVFNGKIIVRPDAQKTDAKQTNKALLLSNEAVVDTKPELEIFANDVKCTHGAAIGQLDEAAHVLPAIPRAGRRLNHARCSCTRSRATS